jgi:hypothetical protein
MFTGSGGDVFPESDVSVGAGASGFIGEFKVIQ